MLPSDDYDAFPRIELVTRQPVASVGPASPIDFAAAFASFRQTSTDLAECPQNVVLRTPNGDPLPRPVPPGSNAVVTLTPGVTNVLDISATDLANIAVLTFATPPTADTPLLVNVDTTDVADAPNADVDALTNSNIEGSVITRTLVHDGGEIHDRPFSTTLDCPQPTGLSLIHI
ncbi:hypothetical protein BSA16_30305 [Micromonospora sp. Rc5]|nr:hypothetical protein BSA16_30305 [Micromonospora sp. Rc5]